MRNKQGYFDPYGQTHICHHRSTGKQYVDGGGFKNLGTLQHQNGTTICQNNAGTNQKQHAKNKAIVLNYKAQNGIIKKAFQYGMLFYCAPMKSFERSLKFICALIEIHLCAPMQILMRWKDGLILKMTSQFTKTKRQNNVASTFLPHQMMIMIIYNIN